MIIPIQWRPKYIEGFEGLYGVVRAGFVFSFKRWKFLAGGTNTQGYKQVQLWKNGKYKTYGVHRLVAQTFLDNVNNLPEVNHKDEDKQNNAVWNLEYCDHKYNMNYGTRNDRVSEANKGKQFTKETRKKLSTALKGKPKTEEAKRNMSIAKKGKPSPRKGKPGKKGKDNPKATPILMYSLESEFIRRFDCIADANEFMGKKRTAVNIGQCARGEIKSSYGYLWKYEE